MQRKKRPRSGRLVRCPVMLPRLLVFPVPAPLARPLHGLLVLGALAWAVPGAAPADEAGPRRVAGAPDLVVGRASLEMAGDGRTLTVSVVNRGVSPAPPAAVRISDRPFLGMEEGPGPYTPRHHLLRGERGLVVWPERTGAGMVLRVRWQGRGERDRFEGRVRIENVDGRPLVPGPPRVVGQLAPAAVGAGDGGWVAWEAAGGRQAAGFDLVFAGEERPAFLVLDRLLISGAPNLHQIYVGNWWLSRYFRNLEPALPSAGGHPDDPESPVGLGRVAVPLDDPRLTQVTHPARTFTMEARLSPLDPGGRGRAVFALPDAFSEVFVLIDPDDEVVEQREGNNAAVWRRGDGRAMVSLHTHSSLSEGYASFDAQMDQLSRSGYDAVFWTEHDWRLTGHEMGEELSFEQEPTPETWSPVTKRLDGGLVAGLRLTSERATSGSRSLRLSGRRTDPPGGPPPEAIWALRTFRAQIIRSLAEDLSVALDLFADADNPFDAEFLLRVQLSDQPHVRRYLTYRIDILPDAVAAGQIVLPPPPDPATPAHASVPPRRWVRIILPVSRHARALFPEGADNNLSGLHLGLALRSGSVRFDVDRLTFETAVRGLDLLDLQRRWGAHYPALASHVTTEISFYIPHFNAFVREPFLLDYGTLPMSSYNEEALRRTRAAQGALSINHPMGFNEPYPAFFIEAHLQERLFGADLLEVGYRYRGVDLVGHLEFWDRSLGAGIVASGVGVTDAHGAGRGNGFERDENNFATWVEADPDSVDSLIDGLLAGRVTFGDPLLYRGRIDLEVDGTYRAGDVVIGPPRARRAAFRGERLEPGGRVDLIADGRVAASATVDPKGRAVGEVALTADTGAIRLESWGPAGEPVAFSNAILFMRKLPPEPLPASRLRLELDHGRLAGEGRFRVDAVEVEPGRVRIEGRQGAGRIRVEGAGAAPDSASVVGSAAPLATDYDPERDRLDVLLAPPGVELRWAGDRRWRGWPWWAAAATALVMMLVWWRRRQSRPRHR